MMYSYGPLHMAKQNQDDLLEPTYRSSVRIRDVALRTCQKRWTIWRSDERGSGISALAARHDDDDDYEAMMRIPFCSYFPYLAYFVACFTQRLSSKEMKSLTGVYILYEAVSVSLCFKALGKKWICLISSQLWLNSWQDCVLSLCGAGSLGEEKLWIQTNHTPLKKLTLCYILEEGLCWVRLGKYIDKSSHA